MRKPQARPALEGWISRCSPDRPSLFGGFLFDLFFASRGTELSGEPEWSLERIELDENFASRSPYINAKNMKTLAEWRRNGEVQAFWMDTDGKEQSVVSNSVFWKVVADAFDEFVKEWPKRKAELDAIVANFPRLQRK